MRNTIILLVALVALLSSCYKKSTSNRKNYYCIQNDSMWSTIPALNNPHYKVIKGNWDQYNQADIDFQIKLNTRMDTFYMGHDTLMEEFWTMSCTQLE